MRLSESEIKALVLVAGSEQAIHPGDLSRALNLHPDTLSRLVTGLVDKGLLERDGTDIVMAGTPAAEAFKKLYFAHRASPFPLLFADRRVDLLARIEDGQKSVEILEKETGIPRKTIYRYLRDFIHLGAGLLRDGPARAIDEGTELPRCRQDHRPLRHQSTRPRRRHPRKPVPRERTGRRTDAQQIEQSPETCREGSHRAISPPPDDDGA